MESRETAKTDYTGMIVIHGDLFVFDKERKTLMEHGNEANRQVMADLDFSFYYVSGLYNTRTKQFSKTDLKKNANNVDSAVKPFNIPKPVAFNGHRLKKNAIWNYNIISLNSRQGFHLVDQELSNRLNGELPPFFFDERKYIVDIEKQEIRQTENPEKKFVFGYEDIFETSEMFYHIPSKSPMIIDPKLTVYPKDVICLKFPRLSELDIVGYAKMSNLHATALVSNFQWRPDPSRIKVLDLSESKVPELVLRNQIEKVRQENKKRGHKGKETKRRRGLGNS